MNNTTIQFPVTTSNPSQPMSTTPKPKRRAITIQRVMEQCENDEYEGICLACGEDAQGVEPDAREYECESCGKEKVFGCEELLMMIG